MISLNAIEIDRRPPYVFVTRVASRTQDRSRVECNMRTVNDL